MSSYKHAQFLLELSLSKDEVSAEVWNQYIDIYNNKRAIIEGDPTTYGVKFSDTNMHSSAYEHLFMKDYEWVSKCVSEWVSERVSEWVSEWASEHNKRSHQVLQQVMNRIPHMVCDRV